MLLILIAYLNIIVIHFNIIRAIPVDATFPEGIKIGQYAFIQRDALILEFSEGVWPGFV